MNGFVLFTESLQSAIDAVNREDNDHLSVSGLFITLGPIGDFLKPEAKLEVYNESTESFEILDNIVIPFSLPGRFDDYGNFYMQLEHSQSVVVGQPSTPIVGGGIGIVLGLFLSSIHVDNLEYYKSLAVRTNFEAVYYSMVDLQKIIKRPGTEEVKEVLIFSGSKISTGIGVGREMRSDKEYFTLKVQGFTKNELNIPPEIPPLDVLPEKIPDLLVDAELVIIDSGDIDPVPYVPEVKESYKYIMLKNAAGTIAPKPNSSFGIPCPPDWHQ